MKEEDDEEQPDLEHDEDWLHISGERSNVCLAGFTSVDGRRQILSYLLQCLVLSPAITSLAKLINQQIIIIIIMAL